MTEVHCVGFRTTLHVDQKNGATGNCEPYQIELFKTQFNTLMLYNQF